VVQLSREAVKTVQAMLNAEFPNVVDDGRWGSATADAYSKASPALRRYIDVTLHDEFGVNTPDVPNVVTPIRVATQRRSAGPKRSTWERARALTTTADVRSLIQQACTEYGVPFNTAYRIAWLESKLNPNAVSPTGAKGVFQLTSIAIADIAKRANYVVRDPMDPVQNVTGGVLYLRLVAHDMGVSLSDAPRIYMGFNIGPRGARAVIQGKPQSVAAIIEKQAYGAPAVYAANLTKAVNSVEV